MPETLLGLDIKSDSVAAVRVKSGLKGYHVTSCAHVMIEEEGGLESALKTLVEQVGAEADVCISSIPGEHISYRNLRMPFKDKKKIRQIITYELETMVPFPLNDLLVDFTIVDQSDQSEVLAATVKQTYVSEYLAQLQSNGINPSVLDISAVSMVCWLLKQAGTPDNGLLLEIGLKRNMMILFLNRRIALIRSFPFNGNAIAQVAIDGTGSSQAGIQSTEQVESCLRSFCTKVQNTIHAFGSQSERQVNLQGVFIAGRGTLNFDIENIINRCFDLPVERVDLTTDPKLQIDENIAQVWNPAVMDNALALAVRETRQGIGFNFRRDRFAVKKQYFGYKKEIRKVAAFLVVILCLLGLDQGVEYYFLKKRYETLDQQITEIFRQAIPDVKRIVDPIHQLKVRINEIKKSALSFSGIGTNRTVLDLLRDISLRVPESADVHMTRMVVDPDGVLLRGETDTFNTVDNIKKGLEPSPYFKAVTISSANLDRSGNRVRFEMKLELTG